MDLGILEILTDEDGLPRLENSSIAFRAGDHALIDKMPRMSKYENCSQLVFIELAPGFSSGSRFTDTGQIVVCLSGILSISTKDGEAQNLVAGSLARLQKTDLSTHDLSVVGDVPVQLMVVQLE